jgi:cardiolipin synthase
MGARSSPQTASMAYVLVAVLLLPVLVLALIGFGFLTRGTQVRRVRALRGARELPGTGHPDFRTAVELHGRIKLAEGHGVELLTCGDDTFPCLFDDLRAARESITLQMYYCHPGKLADEFERILVERAAAGVRVLFMYDAFGAAPMDDSYFARLRAAGVEVAAFRSVKWYSLEQAYSRSHIRVAIVDGAVGYTGGFGIDDKWLGNGRRANEWRDTNVRFTGPAVLALQASFAAGWAESTGDLLSGELFFPAHKHEGARGGVLAATLHSAPAVASSIAERFLAVSIAAARESLYVTNAYFVPDHDLCGMLCDATGRGVDVRILTAGKHNDVKSAWYAGRAMFERLLVAGVRIYEYTPTMMHAKTLVADRVWSSVGTMNFDNRSLSFNDETTFVALDAALGARMAEMFMTDLGHSVEIDLAEFRRRPLGERVIERGLDLVSRVL